jgi:hypothetical protein
MSEQRSSLNGIPFRLLRDGGIPFLEYEGDFGGGLKQPCWLYNHEPAFQATCRLMEQYRALEQKLRDVERERDEAREETKRVQAVIAHKDKALAGYEAQLSRYRKKAEQ